MVFAFFDRFGLRIKLIGIVALMIVSLLVSTLAAQYIISKVQIGGKTDQGIQLKTELIDQLSRTRVNLVMLNSLLKSQIYDSFDPDSLAELKAATNRIAEGLAAITGSYAPTAGQGRRLTCHSCHADGQMNEVVDQAAKGGQAWQRMMAILDQEVLPALQRDDRDTAVELFEGEYADHFSTLLETTKESVDLLRDSLAQVRLSVEREVSWYRKIFLLGVAVVIALLLVMSGVFVEMTVRVVKGITQQLTEGAEQINNEMHSTTKASQTNADMATSMAASLEETCASLEEVTAMTHRNDLNTGEAHKAIQRNKTITTAAGNDMAEMVASMKRIQEDSGKIATIIRDIESIAFQTNLLALNAAVEAARAGEQGQGFAVVAEEVRNLAQRVTVSAKSSNELIERALANVNAGLATVTKVATDATELMHSSEQVSVLIDEIAEASHRQAEGISHINRAVGQMDASTQQLAANSEELAAASVAVKNQLTTLDQIERSLQILIKGTTGV